MRSIHRAFLISRLFIAALIISSTPALAANFSVTNANDSGAGSLRQAITDANASAATPHTITINPNLDIRLLSALPIVTRSLTLNSHNSTLIRIPAAGFLRFSALFGGSFTMNSVRVQRDDTTVLPTIARGGCLASTDGSGTNPWTMRISTSVLINCGVRAVGANNNALGGAIYTNGDTVVIDSVIEFADATSVNAEARGSAIYHSSGVLDIIRTRIVQGSSAGVGTVTGAVALAPSTLASIEDSEFDRNLTTVTGTNAAASVGGAIHGENVALAIRRSAFSGHDAQNGTAILVSGPLRVENASFYRNFATSGGSFPSAIAVAGDLSMRHSAFFDNTAQLAHLDGAVNGFSGNVFAGPNNICVLRAMPAAAVANFGTGSCSAAGFSNANVETEGYGRAAPTDQVPFIGFAGTSPVWDAYGNTGVSVNDFNLCAQSDVRLQPRPRNDDGDNLSECDAGPSEGKPLVPLFKNGFE
jgi:hypothetical protein